MVNRLPNLIFDTVVVNEKAMQDVLVANEIMNIQTIFPFEVIVSPYIPEDMVALRNKDTFVALVNIGDTNE